MKTTNKIDVHHHIFPEEYLNALKEIGVEKSLGVKLPIWTPDTSIKKMKENGVSLAILSISSPGVYFPNREVPEGTAEKLSRLCNDYITDLKEKFPDRFGGFATIPLLNKEAALNELTYALDKCKLDGVCLLTNYNGTYLGDPEFEPFFKELNKRKAVVYIHPTDPGMEYDDELGIPNSLIEVTFDTTRAVANLMYHGVLDRYPDIKYILSHGGGTIPYLAWRLASIEYGQAGKRPPLFKVFYDFLVNREPTKGLNHLRNMYYDTANVSGPYQLKALQEFAGPDHLVFGTDVCISKLAPIITKNLEKDGEFTDEDYNKMSYENSLELFPSLTEYYN